MDSVHKFSAVNTSIKIDQSKLSCFKSFVESKILSKSDKNLDSEKNKTGLFCGLTPAISGVSFVVLFSLFFEKMVCGGGELSFNKNIFK